MNNDQDTASTALLTGLSMSGVAPVLGVNITAARAPVDVITMAERPRSCAIRIRTTQVNPDFAQTSLKRPPFCIQPGELAPGVKTIAELEVLQFLKKINHGDASIIVVDSRTPDWGKREPFPGWGNIPWETLSIGKSDPAAVQEIL